MQRDFRCFDGERSEGRHTIADHELSVYTGAESVLDCPFVGSFHPFSFIFIQFHPFSCSFIHALISLMMFSTFEYGYP